MASYTFKDDCVNYLWSIETKIVSTDWCVEQDLDLKELAFPSMLHEQTQTIYILLLTLYR